MELGLALLVRQNWTETRNCTGEKGGLVKARCGGWNNEYSDHKSCTNGLQASLRIHVQDEKETEMQRKNITRPGRGHGKIKNEFLA